MSEQIHELLAAAAGRVGAIGKTEKNKEQGFMFRSIDAIVSAAKPVFYDLGIAVTPRLVSMFHEPVQSSRGTKGWRCVVEMEFTFTAPDGSSRTASMPGEAIDYGDKSTTKAAQMAFKYCLTDVLLVSSGDTESDAETHDVVPDRQDFAPSVGEWMSNATQIFKEWDQEARREQYRHAMTQLALEELDSIDTAKRVVEFMAGVYYTEFPGDETAPF